MFEREDDVLDRVVRHLKRPARMDPDLDRRVMDRIAAIPVTAAGPVARAWTWLVTPRRVPVSPLGGLAVAATVAALLFVRPWVSPSPGAALDRFQFVLVAPGAGSVSLVGDFNDWDAARTPMRAVRAGGVWTAVLPLAPGRYRYAFLVNGTEWIADPAAPPDADDEFGTPSSVVTVGGS